MTTAPTALTAPTAPQNRAALLSLVAGVVSVVVLVVEGPPGSGYGWGSVIVSAGIVAALYASLARTVRGTSAGAARACVVLALVIAVMFCLALVGNWGGQSTGFRVLDTVAALLALAAAATSAGVALGTLRRAG